MKKYYVYTLTDPQNNRVFYVGKGCGNRAYSHESKCKRNPSKYNNTDNEKKIISILERGMSVIVDIVMDELSENDALQIEAEQIALFGINNLTNKYSHGAPSGDKTSKYGLTLCYKVAEGLLRLPEPWLSDNLMKTKDVNLKTIHAELDEVLAMIHKNANSSIIVSGFSKAIENCKVRPYSRLTPQAAP